MRQQGLQISLGGPFERHHEFSDSAKEGLAMLFFFALLTTVGMSFLLYEFRYRMKKWDDFQYTINCWDRNEAGEMVRVRIWLCKVKSGRDALKLLKRVRCTDLVQDRDRRLRCRTRSPAIVVQS